MTRFVLFVSFLSGLHPFFYGNGAESEPVAKPGIKNLRLVADRDAIVPGDRFTVGLFIQHLPGYHTYWKAPGIVGVPTTIKWDLPPGFTAAAIEWPVPELTKMAQYSCHGYERDVVLLNRIAVSPDLLETESVTLKARIAYMSCAKTCHPGWHDFELVLKVKSGEPEIDPKWGRIFTETRKSEPRSAPPSWQLSLEEKSNDWTLTIHADQAFPPLEGVYFFCEHNLIHSDLPQKAEFCGDRKSLLLTLPISEFAPKEIPRFSGLLFHPRGWPGLDSKWVRVEVALPAR